MNFLFKISAFMLFLVITSCQKDNYVIPTEAEIIKVDIKEKRIKVNFEDYFSSKRIVKLESTDKSIFSQIDRVYFFENRIYIFDRLLKSIFVFSDNGDFEYKISYIGSGPTEYISAVDFTIDQTNKTLILYADKPYALYIYNLIKGNFIKKIDLNDLYNNISMSQDRVVFYNKFNIQKKYQLFEYNLYDNSFNGGKLKIRKRDKTYKNQGLNLPTLIKSEDLYFNTPYSQIIYNYKNKEVKPKYYIDFGKNNLPYNIFKKKKKLNDLFKYARKNNYGFGICGFRENKDFIIFKYLGSHLAIYSKKAKKAELISYIENDDMVYGDYIPHDGNDNNFVSVCYSSSFKHQMTIYKKKTKLWEKVPKHIKIMDSETNKTDNPLLLIYTFKF